PRPPSSLLFPYTTLFRSRLASAGLAALLLAIGIGRRRTAAAPRSEKASIAQARRIGAKQFLVTLYRETSNDRVLAISAGVAFYRSEEHTSELQSRSDLVC